MIRPTSSTKLPPRWRPLLAGIQVSALAQWFGIIGAACYAFGWVLASRLFGRLGVSPEDVGITASWLAIRTFVVAIFIVAGILIGVELIRTGALRGPVVRVIEGRVGIACILLGLVLVPTLVVVLITLMVVRGLGTSTSWPVVAVPALAAGLMVGFLFIRLRGLHEPVSFSWNARSWSRGLGAAALTFIVTMFVGFPYAYGEHLGNRVAAGEEVSIPVIPGVMGLQIDYVTVHPVSAASSAWREDVSRACFLRLGAAEGITVLYDAREERTLRISSGQIVVEGCR